jgi:hypothetical protein
MTNRQHIGAILRPKTSNFAQILRILTYFWASRVPDFLALCLDPPSLPRVSDPGSGRPLGDDGLGNCGGDMSGDPEGDGPFTDKGGEEEGVATLNVV